MHPDLLSRACSLFGTTPADLTPLSGGHYNAVYKFPLDRTWQVSKTSPVSKHGVLRIGVEDCPPEQTLGMLEWVDFLAREGAPVAPPLASTRGQLLEQLEFEGKTYVVTALRKAEGILAEDIPVSEWTDDLFRSIGAAVGMFHRLSSKFIPSNPALTRLHWHESFEIREALRLLPPGDPVCEILVHLLAELRSLPISPADYALIHDDLHFANFLILPGNQVAIIDFDDCGYGWYAIDVAMALFDVLVLYDPSTEADKQHFARHFLSTYLFGYRQENDLPLFWQSRIPQFLKLKELCIYADLSVNQVSDFPGSWVGRFMRGRAERVAGNIPYVDINFSEL